VFNSEDSRLLGFQKAALNVIWWLSKRELCILNLLYGKLRRVTTGSVFFILGHSILSSLWNWAEKLSTFFAFLRLNERIATSPSKIKEVAEQICDLLEAYRQEQEKKHQVDGLKIVGGIDETYFKEMILVLMDLSSGYIFLEEASEDKSYETWLDKVKKVADRFNVEFKYFVSDRAKQLIKLATRVLIAKYSRFVSCKS
jgi:hypothetical protein